MRETRRYELVLAIYPNTRGLAFVLFEGPLAPVDWGVREVRGGRKNESCLQHVRALLDRYHPDALVLQDTSESGARSHRIRVLNSAIAECADRLGLRIATCSRTQVRQSFGYATKHEIAVAIARHVPVFERYLPPKRKPWTSEDARMGLFDAAALGISFFRAEGGHGRAPG